MSSLSSTEGLVVHAVDGVAMSFDNGPALELERWGEHSVLRGEILSDD